MNGLKIVAINNRNNIFRKLFDNTNNYPDNPGIYFLFAKILGINEYLCIYVGSSVSSIKNRLIDHEKKFLSEHLWAEWYKNHIEYRIISRNIYYFHLVTVYGLIIESNIIQYHITNVVSNSIKIWFYLFLIIM